MVFHLLESTHLGNPASYYLNNECVRVFRPYDLICVPQNKKNPEHYVFSVFGVLQIVPDEENEQLTLAEWNRHALLWEACSRIRFFKEFLKRKFLSRWRHNSKFSRFRKLRNAISKDIIHAIPTYNEALCQIAQLLLEMDAIVFLPKDKQINHFTNLKIRQQTKENSTLKILNKLKQKQEIIKETFTLNKYVGSIYDLTKQSDLVLKYFFAYVKYILDHTRLKFYDKCRFYERLINDDGPLAKNDVTKSMSVQKHLGIYRAKELEKLNYQIGLLGNFTDLVGALIGSHMLKICCFEKRHFLQDFEDCLVERREPLFEAELGFDSKDNMCMLPDRDLFVSKVMESVRKVEHDMIVASRMLDFEGALQDREKYGFNMKAKLAQEAAAATGMSQDKLLDVADEDVLKDKDPEAFFELLLSNEAVASKLPIRKPVLNYQRDYDEGLLDNRLVLPFVEDKLKIVNYLLKAQVNPLRPISFAGTLLEK